MAGGGTSQRVGVFIALFHQQRINSSSRGCKYWEDNGERKNNGAETPSATQLVRDGDVWESQAGFHSSSTPTINTRRYKRRHTKKKKKKNDLSCLRHTWNVASASLNKTVLLFLSSQTRMKDTDLLCFTGCINTGCDRLFFFGCRFCPTFPRCGGRMSGINVALIRPFQNIKRNSFHIKGETFSIFIFRFLDK